MFVGNAEEYIAYERHRDLLRQAERNRLIKAVQQQHATDRRRSRTITTWLGVKLVTWGIRLQGQPPQLTAVTVSNGDCPCL
jgi:hypothetical protein